VKPTLVDSSVLLDVATEDPKWLEWSSRELARCAAEAPLLIDQVIWAEVSIRFATVDDAEIAFPRDVFQRSDLPWDAAFVAGKVYARYLANRGGARHPLPDFFIGAHAAVSNLRLLTRDPRRIKTYFPAVELICP